MNFRMITKLYSLLLRIYILYTVSNFHIVIHNQSIFHYYKIRSLQNNDSQNSSKTKILNINCNETTTVPIGATLPEISKSVAFDGVQTVF